MATPLIVDRYEHKNKTGPTPEHNFHHNHNHTKVELRATKDHGLFQDGSSNKGGNKLHSYSLYKTLFHIEPYLQMQDRNARRTLAKFRCSDHALGIGVRRYRGVPEKDRICRRCSLNCTENEEHFLSTCNAYDEPRDKVVLFFRELVPNFGNLALREKFMFIMSNENLGLMNEIATFLEMLLNYVK